MQFSYVGSWKLLKIFLQIKRKLSSFFFLIFLNYLFCHFQELSFIAYYQMWKYKIWRIVSFFFLNLLRINSSNLPLVMRIKVPFTKKRAATNMRAPSHTYNLQRYPFLGGHWGSFAILLSNPAHVWIVLEGLTLSCS